MRWYNFITPGRGWKSATFRLPIMSTYRKTPMNSFFEFGPALTKHKGWRNWTSCVKYFSRVAIWTSGESVVQRSRTTEVISLAGSFILRCEGCGLRLKRWRGAEVGPPLFICETCVMWQRHRHIIWSYNLLEMEVHFPFLEWLSNLYLPTGPIFP